MPLLRGAVGATAEEIWTYETRELTQTKFPFWSAIIQQSGYAPSIAAGTTANYDIQPPANETWLIWIAASIYAAAAGCWTMYSQFDGTTAVYHVSNYQAGTYGMLRVPLYAYRVLTNSLYARVSIRNASGISVSASYGYSGFKLSEPLWRPKKVSNPGMPSWKRGLTVELPTEIAALEPYAAEVWDLEKAAYVPVIMLEEDTPLATDPNTGFPIERCTVYVTTEDLVRMLPDIKANPIETGYEKYLAKWKEEGIEI